jgi:hypothetical protein
MPKRINLERIEMSVEIGASVQSMPESLSSLRITPSNMHRISFKVETLKQWYAIMAEARQLYQQNWRAQPRVKRRLERYAWSQEPVRVWFEVPDPAFATWCAVKLAVEPVGTANK